MNSCYRKYSEVPNEFSFYHSRSGYNHFRGLYREASSLYEHEAMSLSQLTIARETRRVREVGPLRGESFNIRVAMCELIATVSSAERCTRLGLYLSGSPNDKRFENLFSSGWAFGKMRKKSTFFYRFSYFQGQTVGPTNFWTFPLNFSPHIFAEYLPQVSGFDTISTTRIRVKGRRQ